MHDYLFDNILIILEPDGPQDIRELHPFANIETAQDLDGGQELLVSLPLLDTGVLDDLVEGLAVQRVEHAGGGASDRGRTGRVVQQSQFPERVPRLVRPQLGRVFRTG